MRVSTAVLAVALAGCAPTQPAACPSSGPEAAVIDTPAAPLARPPTPLPVPAPAPPKPASPCWARGKPTTRPARSPGNATYCGSFDGAELARVEARIRKDFDVSVKPSKLVVDFGCDVAVGETRQVVFEDGSGHGGSLRIARFDVDDERVRVRVIDSSHYHAPGSSVRTGEVAALDFARLVARSRVALLARPHLIHIARTDGGMGAFSISTSSNDFHLSLAIRDVEGRVTARRFTGYAGTRQQEIILPIRFGTEGFSKLLATLPLAETEPTDDDRRFFSERFVETMEGDPYWWVRERYVSLAARFGTADVVPALVTLARQKGDASVARTREKALATIAAITGWDPRKADDGSDRTEDEAVAVAAEQCAL